MKILITCEHGGNTIPNDLNRFLKIPELVLKSHRGFDPGSLACAEYTAKHTKSFMVTNTISRLVIDFNRSTDNKELFSEFSSNLQEYHKQILLGHYSEYRNKAEDFVKKSIRSKQEVIHFSFHTFVPELDGKIRDADIGILYDNSQKQEKLIAENLRKALKAKDSELRVKMNYPYSGKSDGFTTYLRKVFPKNYSGIEIEYNQSLFGDKKRVKSITDTIKEFLNQT